jgi:peptidoglycan DL-endopeptidase CwlO
VRRRGPYARPLRTGITLVIVGAILSPLSVAPAHSATIAQSEAEIARLSSRLARLSQTGEISANAYDSEVTQLATIVHRLHQLQGQVDAARVSLTNATRALESAVVDYYVSGPVTLRGPSFWSQSAAQEISRTLYKQVAIDTMTHLQTTYSRDRTSLESSVRQVERQRTLARHATDQAHALLVENSRNAVMTRATMASISRTLASKIISYEVRRGVNATKRHDTSGEVQAITAASSVGGQAAANTVTLAIQSAASPATATTSPAPIRQVAPSARGLAAVHYAESQIGVPYLWGGETPGVGFDCSGLVQWAWGRAGVSIPRTTETQWPALAHVPLTSLEPGDLLYYYNLDGDHLVDHLVMYVGSGPYGVNTVIAAAHSGTTVSYAPLFTAGLIGASRP